MKLHKFLTLLLLIPILAGCKKDEPQRPAFKLPEVNVDNIQITLPNIPTRGGNIRSDSEYDYLDFYELSDFHGMVNYTAGQYLGLSRLASYLDIKRSLNPGGTVVLSSGDMFQGSAESNLTKGFMVNYAMGYMGFDAMAIGNHEFDWGDAALSKNANLEYLGKKIPYLGANIYDKRTNQLASFAQKSTIVERGNHKIGIIGTIGESLEHSIIYTNVKNYDFRSEITAVRSEASALRNQGCDVVVWLSHDGLDNNLKEGLTSADGVNAVFCGHAHINTKDVRDGIPYIATKNYGQSVAHIQLKIAKTGGTVTVSNNYYDDNPTNLSGLYEDTNVTSIMNQYATAINAAKNYKLGSCDSELERDGALKNICTEAMFVATKEAISNSGGTININQNDLLAAYHNISGGIRSDVEKGEITYGDIYTPFPFDNEIVLIKTTGREYKSKVTSMNYRSFAICKSYSEYSSLDSNKDYYIITSDYLALNELAFNKTEDEIIRTGYVVRDSIAKFIYDKETIKSSDFSDSIAKYQHPIF